MWKGMEINTISKQKKHKPGDQPPNERSNLQKWKCEYFRQGYIQARYSRISKIWTSRGQESKGTWVQKYGKKSLQIRLMNGIFGRADKEHMWKAFNIKLGNWFYPQWQSNWGAPESFSKGWHNQSGILRTWV